MGAEEVAYTYYGYTPCLLWLDAIANGAAHTPVPPTTPCFFYLIWLCSGQVAACALEAALRGRAEVVPGLLPRLYVGLTDRRLLLSIELYRATPGV